MMENATVRREPNNGFDPRTEARHRRGLIWRLVFQASTVVGIIALMALLYNIINQSFGIVAVVNKVDPATLAIEGVPLEDLSKEQLVGVLEANVSKGLFRRFAHDMPFEERSSEDVYQLVLERVVEPDQDVQCFPIAAPRTAGLLPHTGDGPRVPHQNGRVEISDVNAQFQRRGSRQTNELAAEQRLL